MSANVRRNLAVQLTAGGTNPLKLRVRGNLPFKIGTAVSASLVAQGGTMPYAYSITAGALPTTATFNASITTTVMTVNSITNGTIVVGQPIFGTGVTAGQTVVSFGTGTGGTGTYNLGISNTLTSRAMTATLALAAATGILTGTPSVAGSYTFTAQVQDAIPTVFSGSFEMPVSHILQPGNVTPPPTEQGASYSYTFSVTGATGAVTWAITSGSLPPSITLTGATGKISGTATGFGSYTFTITATDAGTGDVLPIVCTMNLYANVQSPFSPTVILNSGTNYTSVVSYNVINPSLGVYDQYNTFGGVLPYKYSSSNLATVAPWATLNPNSGVISGSPTTVQLTPQVINLTVTDALGFTSSPTVTFTVVNVKLGAQQAGVDVGTVGLSKLNFTGGGVSVGSSAGVMTVTIPTGAGGVTSVSGTAPVVSSGGATPAISMAAATTSVPGYLLAADWTTFNNKQATVSFAAVGSTPNANGGGIAAGVITLQPADGSNPGALTAIAQTIGGDKTFSGKVIPAFLKTNGVQSFPGAATAGISYFYNDTSLGTVIYGFGSAADITIANRAGTAVITVLANTTTTRLSGLLDLNTVGAGIQVAEGSNAKQGTAVLVAGTKVVSNTSVTANSRIFLTSNVDGGTPGFVRVSTRTAGTSFTITSSNAADTSTIAFEIFEPG